MFDELGEWSYRAHRMMSGLLPSFGSRVPILWQRVLPYGRCIGQTRFAGRDNERDRDRAVIMMGIRTLTTGETRGTLLHEMLHLHLYLRGDDHRHAGKSWAETAQRLMMALGVDKDEINTVAPVKNIRRDGARIRAVPAGFLPRKQLARFPHDGLPATLSALHAYIPAEPKPPRWLA